MLPSESTISSNQQGESSTMATHRNSIKGPLLGLRMRGTRSCHLSDREVDDMVDRLHVMISQEREDYRCQDYLARRKMDDLSIDSPLMPLDGPTVYNDELDAICREKMCEWTFRVCDHFHANREIVAISLSFLDRFVDKCCCDRTAFKLAAMTTLYIATKIYNAKEISMSSLAELSRGEFDMSHIAEMERVILQTLGWRMHPPTVQSFIAYFHTLLQIDNGPVSKAIFQRAVFFSELSLYDYFFVTQERSAIAIAAILNSLEGMEETLFSKEHSVHFLESIKSLIGLEFPEEQLDLLRKRLWYVYSMSAQYREEDAVVHAQAPMEQPTSHPIGKETSGGVHSPVSVALGRR